jgi:hypothetical protein
MEFLIQLVLNRDHLYNSNYSIKLIITFGATYSPKKICEYKIELGPSIPKNIQHMNTSIRENIFFHKNEATKGLTDKEKLNKFRGL